MPKNWKLSHDPENPTLGCNGKPGDSGRNRHRRRGEDVCPACNAAAAFAARERRRGQGMPRPLHPCGTPAAARRHRENDERLCVPCASAEAGYHVQHRAKARHGKCPAGEHYQTPDNVYTRNDGSVRCRPCIRQRYAAKQALKQYTPERIAA